MFRCSPFGWISQYFIGFFFAYGVYLPFWALWFEDQGVSASDIGILLGLGFATRCISNLLFTPRVHKAEQLLPALRWLTLSSLIACGLYLFTDGNFWLMAGATVLFNLSCGPAVPLSDALANYYAKLKLLDYGKTRLWGSISFIAGSTIVGYLVAGYGTSMIVYTAIAGIAMSMIFVMRNPTIMPVTQQSEHHERPKLIELLKNSSVIRFLVLVGLIQGSHAAFYSFSSIYWKEAGYQESTIGYLWSLGVVAEVAIFAFSQRLFGSINTATLFKIAALGVVIRWGLTASTTELLGLVVVQLLHSITFATAHIAAIKYIQKSPDNKMVAMQALYNALPLGAFIALMTALSGWAYEAWGGQVFWLMALMGIPALFIKLEKVK
jgi:PPP family 3-phenylpropionic acid transporter